MAEEDFDKLSKSKLKNLEKIKELGIEPYPYKFEPKNMAADIQKKYAKLKEAEHTKDKAVLAGRLLSFREFGKLIFADLLDGSGKIQLSFRSDVLSKEKFALLKNIDTGDFLGLQGIIFKTKKGELTVSVEDFELLSKSIRPLPEKWHGLKDIEIRYRQRYLDLISNPEIKEVFAKRAEIIKAAREFLDEKGFVEVEIPLLQPMYGGANARPFVTESWAWKSKFYLSISPELYLKRLIVGGFDKVYTICKNFRNEGVDKTHNPEFTMMECYASYWDYNDVMKLTEDLFVHVVKKINNSTKIEYQGVELDFKAPWKKMTMYEAMKKYANLDIEKLKDNDLRKLIEENKIELDVFKRGLAISHLFEHFCQDKLIQPIHLTDHPKETTPLCKLKRGNKDLIERFESFINGWEMTNGYSELNDPVLQRKFFEEQSDQGRAKGESHPIDSDYIEAMEYGMPPTGGLGLGIDRLVMLLTNSATIKDVIFFPQLRPEK